MAEYKLRPPGYFTINGKPTNHYYIAWSEGGRSHRRSTGTADLGDANGFLSAFITTLEAPPETFDLAMMIAGYIDEAPDQEHHAKALTRLLGHLTLPDLTRSQVRMFVTARRKEGASNGTIRRQIGVLRAAINWAWKERWITKDEIPHIEAPKPPPPRDRFLTYDEFMALYGAAVSPHMQTFLALGIWTGQRAGAILELTWENVDFDRALVFFKGGNETKRRAAAVAINAPLALALGRAALSRDCDHVVSYGGRPVSTVKKAFGRCVKRAGLEDVRVHDLRRSAASWVLQNGGTFEDAALLLNDDIRTVQRHYSRFNETNMRDVTGRIAR